MEKEQPQKNRFEFNAKLWEVGKKIEDAILPSLNEVFKCDFKRSDDIFDIIDFYDDVNKVAVEVKGRRIPSTQYKDTIITKGKITKGYNLIDEDWKVYYVFVFTDKVLYTQLKENTSWKVKLTGTFGIEHFMIPVAELKELSEEKQ